MNIISTETPISSSEYFEGQNKKSSLKNKLSKNLLHDIQNSEKHSEAKKVAKKVKHIWDLDKIYEAYEDNFANMIARYAIKQIIDLFIKNKGKKISTLGSKEYSILETLFERCYQDNMAVSLGAFDKDNHLYAGAIFIANHSKVIFLFSGTSKTAKNKFNIFKYIDNYATKNIQTLLS